MKNYFDGGQFREDDDNGEDDEEEEEDGNDDTKVFDVWKIRRYWAKCMYGPLFN